MLLAKPLYTFIHFSIFVLETHAEGNLSMAVRLLRTVIDDFGEELTPTLKYDLWLRLNFALEYLESVEKDVGVECRTASVRV